MANILYISYDGMTDPLGQSQVIPYLKGLANKGYKIHLISYEKEIFKSKTAMISTILSEYNIVWHPQNYTKNPPVVSTLWDVYKLKKLTKQLHQKHQFSKIHCRSYIAALVGLEMKQKYNVPFIFDMRGFWADERIDGKIWDLNNILYKKIYSFFKQKEKLFVGEADTVISLTHNGKKEIESWEGVTTINPIETIPCCVDLAHFNIQNQGIKKDEAVFTLGYLGSIGTWYMLPEMLDFFVELLKVKPKAIFHFVTKESPIFIYNVAKAKGIDIKKLKIEAAERKDIPTILSSWDASVFFILPSYSKKASSPVKQGELMAMGIPVFANTNVGDTDYVINTYKSGILVNNFEKEEYIEKINLFFKSTFSKQKIREGAKDFYALEKGIEQLAAIYKK